jgi:hypothetical protein
MGPRYADSDILAAVAALEANSPSLGVLAKAWLARRVSDGTYTRQVVEKLLGMITVTATEKIPTELKLPDGNWMLIQEIPSGKPMAKPTYADAASQAPTFRTSRAL